MAEQHIQVEKGLIDPFLCAKIGHEILSVRSLFLKTSEQDYFFHINKRLWTELDSLQEVFHLINPDNPPDNIWGGLFEDEDIFDLHCDEKEYSFLRSLNCIGTGELKTNESSTPIVVGDLITVNNSIVRPQHTVDPMKIPRVALVMGWLRNT